MALLAAITIKPPPVLAGMLLADVLQYMTPLVVSVSRSPVNALLLIPWDMEFHIPAVGERNLRHQRHDFDWFVLLRKRIDQQADFARRRTHSHSVQQYDRSAALCRDLDTTFRIR